MGPHFAKGDQAMNEQLLKNYLKDLMTAKARFFALGSECGFKSEGLKEKAKKAFNVESFNLLTLKELNFLIEKLEEKLNHE